MSAAPILVRRLGNAIDLYPEDGSPFPPALLSAIRNKLVVHKRIFLRNGDRVTIDGVEQRSYLEKQRLYDIGTDGRLMTCLGTLPTLAGIIQQFGLGLRCVDHSPPRPRPNCFEPDWGSIQFLQDQGRGWRYRQEECAQTIAASLGGIIQGPPAMGKTEIIGRLALVFPHAKIAIVAKRVDIARGIWRRLTKLIPNVGFVGDGDKKKRRVTVYVAKSLRHAEPDTDFVFVDEVHEIVAEEFVEIFQSTFLYARCFGFSATPDDRVDGLSMRLEYMFGPKLFLMTWPEAVANKLVCNIHVNWMNVVLPNNPVSNITDDTERLRQGVWLNMPRNQVIATAFNERPPDEQDLILVRSVEHLFNLAYLLPQCHLCYGELDEDLRETLRCRGRLPANFEPMTSTRRENMRIAFEEGRIKKAIATDVWSTGVSFDQLCAVFRGDAGSNPIQDEQAPGRSCRLWKGKEVGLVYDCWDHWDSGFRRWSSDRDKRYADKGWTRHRPKVLESGL